MYSEEKDTPKIVELGDNELRLNSDIEDRPTDLYLDVKT